MKRKLCVLSFFAVAVFLVTSCAKYNKMLDIDFKEMEFDGNMNWGIPLVNADYGIDDILNQLGNLGIIRFKPNGDAYFQYAIPKVPYLSGADYSRLYPFHQYDVYDFSESIGYITEAEIVSDLMKVCEATLQSGEIVLDFSNVSVPTEIDYDLLVESNSIRKVNGDKFSVRLSKSNPKATIPVKGYKIIPVDTAFLDIITTLIPAEPVTSLIINPKFSFLNFRFSEAKIRIIEDYDYSFIKATAFAVFPQNINMDIVIHEPKLLLDITNTFGVEAEIEILEANLKGKTHSQSIRNDNSSVIHIPSKPNNLIDITQVIKKDIPLSSKYDSLEFACIVRVPKGITIVKFNSIVAAGIKFEVPFDITIDEAVFQDTLAFKIQGLSNLSILDTVAIRTAFESSIPSNFKAQILLYNSTKRKVIGSLLEQPLQITGSFTGNMVTTAPQFINITQDGLKVLQEADKMILQLSLTTEEQHKTFNKSNRIHARIGARIKTANKL